MHTNSVDLAISAAVTITFTDGTPPVGDEPYCFPFTLGVTQIKFSLGSADPGPGCHYIAATYLIGSDGTLAIIGSVFDPVVLGGVKNSLNIDTPNTPDPCFYCSLVVTRKCDDSSVARIVATREFKICTRC